MCCGNVIKWYDLVPVLSYILLKGKCRNCGTKLSVQYPIIESLNGILYCVIFATLGINAKSVLTMLLASALIVIAVIDWRTFEIPFGLNVFITVLGLTVVVIKLAERDITGIADNLIGAVSVSGFLLILYLVTKGRGIGGGDIKLMAATGLLIGWKLNILAFFLGCIYGSVIHIIRMKISGKGHVLALGPYLAAGVMTAVLVGKEIIDWYFGMLG